VILWEESGLLIEDLGSVLMVRQIDDKMLRLANAACYDCRATCLAFGEAMKVPGAGLS